MIRALIFDCFGVLYHGSLGHLRELTPAERWQELEDMRIAYDRGYITLGEYRQGISELTGMSGEDIEKIMSADHIRNDELVKLVREYKKSYKTALLTNVGVGLLNQLFSSEEQTELFDVVVESNKLGITKPSPEIYTHTASQLVVEPSECVMIDDLEGNIEGAKAVGMDGIVFRSVDKMRRELFRKGISDA